ncbi:MAG TPA: prolyl oligopeptidase family serine peptidase, partial [Cellvibrionaceae bacterium]
MQTNIPYGQWPSPITPQTLTSGSLRLGEVQTVGDYVYWLESRPDEGGRSVLMQQRFGSGARELLDASISVRSRAHEYGGGSYLATADAVYAVFDSDQRLYQIPLDRGHSLTPQALTPEGPFRYADMWLDTGRQRLLAVREDYTGPGEARAEIIAIDLAQLNRISVLASGADFYSNPRLSPDGNQLVYLAWDHPNMPWDGTRCSLAQLNSNGEITDTQVIAGGDSESVFQPQWGMAGELYFVSDKNNWWNLYCFDGTAVQPVIEMQAEFATPQWVFGMSTYAVLSEDKIACCYSQNGLWQLALLTRNKTRKGFKLHAINTPMSELCYLAGGAEHLLFIGAHARRAPALYHLLAQSLGPKAAPPLQLIRRSQPEVIDSCYFSAPEPMHFSTTDNDTAYGFYYAPKNPDARAPKGDLPPLLVMSHGGPTGATSSALSYKIQFWTSRGFAVLDVNYRGSTGFGRHYRDKLKGHWGISDVIDMASGAQALVDQDLAHPHKLLIRGSSAGGFTVLAALTFTDTFAAGASLYGIGDLEALVRDTHKFESRYLDSLIGPYPAARDVYQARSPIHHIEQLNCP